MPLESIPAHSRVTEATAKVKSANVGLLLVIDKDNLLGVITGRDIVACAVAANRLVDKTPVHGCNERSCGLLDGDDDVADAARVMADNNVCRLGVVTHLSLTDAIEEPLTISSVDLSAIGGTSDSTDLPINSLAE